MTPKEKQILSVIAAVAVLAGGYVWATKYRQTPPPSPSPSTSSADRQGGGNEATTDETADWKTYRNEEYGFEVKYPNKFSLDYLVSIGKLNSFPTSEDEISQEVKDSGLYNRIYKKDILQRKQDIESGKPVFGGKIIRLDGRNAEYYYRYEVSGGYYEVSTTYFFDNADFVTISDVLSEPLLSGETQGYLDANKERLTDLYRNKFTSETAQEVKNFNQILSTFRFTK